MNKLIIIACSFFLLALPIHLVSQDSDPTGSHKAEKEYDFTSDGYMYFVITNKNTSLKELLDLGIYNADKNGYFNSDTLLKIGGVARFLQSDIDPQSTEPLKVDVLCREWTFCWKQYLERDHDFIEIGHSKLHRRTMEVSTFTLLGSSKQQTVILVSDFNFEALIQIRQKELKALRDTNKF